MCGVALPNAAAGAISATTAQHRASASLMVSLSRCGCRRRESRPGSIVLLASGQVKRAPARLRRGLLGLLLAGGALGDRKLDEERRALAVVALDPDAAFEAAHQLAADVEAEARAADAARHVRVEAIELLEDAPALGDRDAEALVRDRPADAALSLRHLDRDGAAFRRVLDRVLDQVHEHLAELLLVGRDRGKPLRGLERERHPVREMRLRCVDDRLGHL